MPTFTISQPPEIIDEPITSSGACFSVDKNDDGCFSISTFDEGCFSLNYFPSAGYESPPSVVIEDQPLSFTGIHVQGTRLLILDGATNIMYDYKWSFDKANNIIWASGKSSQTVTGLTDYVSDIYSNSNIHSNEDVFVGLTEQQHGAFGQWVSTLIFHASSKKIDGRAIIGESGDVRIPTASEPSTLTEKIGCDPTGDGNSYKYTVNQRYLQNKDALKRVVSAMGRITYEYLGDNYFYTDDLPDRTTTNVSDFHHVLSTINYYHSINNSLVAGWGFETNSNILYEKQLTVFIGGDLESMTYERYELTTVEGEIVTTTCTYSFTGWNTEKHIVFPTIAAISVDEVAFYLSSTHIVFIGTATTQSGSDTYGVFYYRYDEATNGRTEGSIGFKDADWTTLTFPIDITLADDVLLYVVNVDGDSIVKTIILD